MRSRLIVLLGALQVYLFAGTLYAAPGYVGAEGCKCHKAEIADWERSGHGKAFNLLKPGKKKSKKKKAGLDPKKDYTRDEKCLKCHVTGKGEEGGFRDFASTPGMAGVGCESCHGPGSEYRSLHKEKTTAFSRDEAKALGETYGSLDAGVCETCHVNKDNPFKPEMNKKYKFDHGAALKKNREFHDYYELEGQH